MHYCVNLSGHLSSQHVLSLSFQAHLANNHVFLCQTETNFSMGWRQFWLRTWPFWITLGDFCWLLIFQPILAFLRAFVKFGKPLQWISHPSLIIIFPKFLINSQFTWEQYQLTPYKNLFQDKFVSVMKNCVNVSGLFCIMFWRYLFKHICPKFMSSCTKRKRTSWWACANFDLLLTMDRSAFSLIVNAHQGLYISFDLGKIKLFESIFWELIVLSISMWYSWELMTYHCFSQYSTINW